MNPDACNYEWGGLSTSWHTDQRAHRCGLRAGHRGAHYCPKRSDRAAVTSACADLATNAHDVLSLLPGVHLEDLRQMADEQQLDRFDPVSGTAYSISIKPIRRARSWSDQ